MWIGEDYHTILFLCVVSQIIPGDPFCVIEFFFLLNFSCFCLISECNVVPQ